MSSTIQRTGMFKNLRPGDQRVKVAGVVIVVDIKSAIFELLNNFMPKPNRAQRGIHMILKLSGMIYAFVIPR